MCFFNGNSCSQCGGISYGTCGNSWNGNWGCGCGCGSRVIIRNPIVNPPTPVTPQEIESVYAGATAVTVAAGGFVPIAPIAQTPSSTLTVTGGAVALPAGSYLITYSMQGSNPTADGDVLLSLYANGAQIAGETVSEYATTGTLASGSKTIVYTTASPVSLTLVNTSGSALDYASASITATKIA